jgi:putative membrane protein
LVVAAKLLADSERQTVEAAIRSAEQTTSAEFVAAIARRVERHHAVSLVAGTVAALAAGLLLALWDPWLSPLRAIGFQCLGFIIVYALFELTPVSAWLAPSRKKNQKVRRFAHLLFFDRGLGALPQHNGVLLFVALAERQVEIVADHALDASVGTAEWQRIVDAFAATARTGKIAAALEAAIRDLGSVLARHHPAAAGQASRVPDRLIEL